MFPTYYGRGTMKMGHSCLLLIFYFVLIHLVFLTAARYWYCYTTGNYTSNSTYRANLKTLLASMIKNTKIDYGFYNFSAGEQESTGAALGLPHLHWIHLDAPIRPSFFFFYSRWFGPIGADSGRKRPIWSDSSRNGSQYGQFRLKQAKMSSWPPFFCFMWPCERKKKKKKEEEDEKTQKNVGK